MKKKWLTISYVEFLLLENDDKIVEISQNIDYILLDQYNGTFE
jgi:hypothetical protein